MSLVRTALSQKSTHFSKGGIYWISWWSFEFSTEILWNNDAYYSITRLGHIQSSAVLHTGKNLLVCRRNRTWFTVNLICQVQTQLWWIGRCVCCVCLLVLTLGTREIFRGRQKGGMEILRGDIYTCVHTYTDWVTNSHINICLWKPPHHCGMWAKHWTEISKGGIRNQ